MNALDRVRASFARQGLMRAIGAEITGLSPGRCTITCPFSDAVTQQHGLFHGGVLTSLADTAAGFAAMTLMPGDAEVLSVEFKINFLRPGSGIAAVARGEVLKPGRTITTCRAEIHMRAEDGTETHAATMLATMFTARPVPSPTPLVPSPAVAGEG